jgi:ATP-dependent RNA helicase RhlE
MINTNAANKFADLELLPSLLKTVSAEGYTSPTPIQQKAIPIILKGKDLLGIAQTGTGKTAAFCLPILQNLMKNCSSRDASAPPYSKNPSADIHNKADFHNKNEFRLLPKNPRVLILAPTRELAIQVHQSLQTYGKGLPLKFAAIYGGVGHTPQIRALEQGVDVLVATPGRLMDLIDQKHVFLKRVEVLVLDEADRMLDMGFIQDIRKILPLLPKQKQNLFFSATMPKEVRSLAESILFEPEKVSVTPESTTVEKITQKVLYVQREQKMDLLLHLLNDNMLYKVLVFVDMKHMANRVSDKLIKNRISASAIHGNKSQNARQKAIEDFRSDKLRVLVATDIAARGIDIEGITHVINYDLPHIVESYVHRIGRTARAGSEGEAISFCTGFEKSFLFAIEKTTRAQIEVDTTHPFHSQDAANSPATSIGKAKAMKESERGSRPRRPRFFGGKGKGKGKGNQSKGNGYNSKGNGSSKGPQSKGGSGGGGHKSKAFRKHS